MPEKALIIVDAQNCFFPGGELPAPGGDKILGPLNDLTNEIEDRDDWLTALSRDWHPRKTKHFKQFGGPWPEHGVRQTHGARFHYDLLYDFTFVGGRDILISKAMGADEDGYSALCPNAYVDIEGLSENLGSDDDASELISKLPNAVSYFQSRGVKKSYVAGLVTDVCVIATALGSLEAGFQTNLLLDACCAINIKPGDEARAVKKMEEAGVVVTSTEAVLTELQA